MFYKHLTMFVHFITLSIIKRKSTTSTTIPIYSPPLNTGNRNHFVFYGSASPRISNK